MTISKPRRQASNWLSLVVLGLAVIFIFVVIALCNPVRAETKSARVSPADTQQFSARRHGRHRAMRRHRGARSYTDANGNRASSVSLSGIVAPQLVAKAREIMATCGSIVVSARAARGNRSNHPIGRAVDMRGNPSCIYSLLHGWPGGKSNDYASAPGGPHVHISYNPGGQEWGLTFAHNHSGGRHYAGRHHRRYATVTYHARRHHRYASAR